MSSKRLQIRSHKEASAILRDWKKMHDCLKRFAATAVTQAYYKEARQCLDDLECQPAISLKPRTNMGVKP